jgi:hypothetical protein
VIAQLGVAPQTRLPAHELGPAQSMAHGPLPQYIAHEQLWSPLQWIAQLEASLQ